MSLIFNEALLGAAGQGGYEIEQSLRFNSADSAYLNRTPGSTGDRQIWTYSFWWKMSNLSTEQYLISADTSGNNETWLRYNADGTIRFQTAGGSNANLASTAVFRDPSAWYHFVLVFDSTEATASNRVLIYVNGVQQTLSGTNPNLNETQAINNTVTHQIMRRASSSGNYGNGYLAEVNFIDGSALDPTDFGEYDDNGVWRPIKYAGSYTGNSFYLKFNAADVDGDSSGLGNDFTATGVTTSGTGTDVMDDTPTNNFATLNPLIGHDPGGLKAPTFSDGNLTVAPQVDSNNNSRVASPTLARNPADGGVWRWEMVVNNNSNASYGIMAIDEDYGQGNFGPYWAASGYGGTLSVSGGASGGLQEQHQTISAGDVIGIVVSFDDNEIGWYINGTRRGFRNGCNFSNYTHLVPFCKESTRTATPCTFDVNFGQKAFQYTTSGNSWGDLSLLPAPEIADGSQYFDTVLWNGDGTSNRAFTNVLDFQPNFSWVKSRSNGESHVLQDSVRGLTGTNGLQLNSNNTNTEGNNGNGDVGAYTSTGFTLSDGTSSGYPRSGVNRSGYTYAGWFWKAGTASGSSNTNGSITSTVSASPSSGFSIITYSGNSTNNSTIGHGLGVAPSMIITKVRTGASNEGWPVWHTSLGGNTKYLQLNQTNSVSTDSNIYGGSNNTAPTSTVYSVGSGGVTNTSGRTYVAYCFAEVEGYSKFGDYTGNGSSDGIFIYLGFKPAWFMLKAYSDGGEWLIIDSTRDTYNNTEAVLEAHDPTNESGAEDADMDFLSNGIKFRNSGYFNTSGRDFIYMAFAENPFGGDGVSAATAR